jgi:hypothetical protein
MKKGLSKGAKKIEKILQENHIRYSLEKTFPNLKSSKGKFLRFDFAIYDYKNNLISLIEYDGEAHFQKINHFYKNNTKFLNAQGRDRKKNSYCLAYNIPLYRIPYWDINKISTLKDLFSKSYRVISQYHNDLLQPK